MPDLSILSPKTTQTCSARIVKAKFPRCSHCAYLVWSLACIGIGSLKSRGLWLAPQRRRCWSQGGWSWAPKP